MNISNSTGSLLKRLHTGAHIDPMRDWLALLACATIALTGIVVWNIWAFDTIAQGGVIGSSTASTPAVLDSPSLNAVRAVFEERAAEEAKYRTGVYRYSDPSQ